MKYFVRGLTAVLLLVVIQVLACAQSVQLWSSYKSFELPDIESAIKMVHGPDGSFYTLGVIGFGSDTLEISRFDSSGNVVWVRHFPGSKDADIAVSSAWVVVTTAVKRGPPAIGALGTALLRYDTSGNASAPVYQEGKDFTGVALASNGDAIASYFSGTSNFLTGQTTFNEAGYVRYSSAGTLLTTKIYSSASGAWGSAIMDNAQGITLEGGVGANRFVAQYTDSGTLKWDHLIAIDAPTPFQSPVRLASDPSGLTYLLLNYNNDNTGNNGARVLKFDLSGTLVYDDDFPEAFTTAFAAGPSGQVGLVTTEVIQLTPSGVVQWHMAPGGVAHAAAYDASGNLYYGGQGSSGGFIALVNSSGVRQWLTEDATPGGVGDFVGVSLATGGAVGFGTTQNRLSQLTNLALFKVDTTGAKVWSTQNGPSDSAEVTDDSATDASGNTYVAGIQGADLGLSLQGVLAKFDSNGTVQWSQHFGNSADDVEIHPAGGIVVAEASPFGPGRNDITLRRFSAAGVLLWQNTQGFQPTLGDFDANTSSYTKPRHSICIDPAGNTYLLGNLGSGAVGVCKFDPLGNLVWSGGWNSPDTNSLTPMDIAVAPDGLVYVAATHRLNIGTDVVVIQFSAAGVTNWTQESPSLWGHESALALVTDSASRVYALIEGSSASVWKLDTTGATAWMTVIPGLDVLPEMRDIALDSSGNVLVGGSTSDARISSTSPTFRAVAAKLTGAGVPVWTTLWADPQGSYTLGKRIALDGSGNVVLGGDTWNNDTARDYFVFRVNNSTGQPLWPDTGDVFRNGAAIYDGGWRLEDTFSNLGLDPSGNIYVGGTSVGPEGTYDLNVVKYSPTSGTRPPLDSQFVGQTIASSMASGQTYFVTVSFKNTGSTPWTKATGFKLGSMNPELNSTWGLSTVSLGATETINPGDTKVFKFPVYAPGTAGNFNFQWQMRSSAGVFGQASTNVVEPVLKKAHAARFLSESTATTVKAGQQFWVQVSMKNVGTNTWSTAGGYSLRPVTGMPTWGVAGVPVSGSVLPGGSTTFLFPATAPGTPGTYKMEWQMYRTASFWTGFFGDTTPVKTITVVP